MRGAGGLSKGEEVAYAALAAAEAAPERIGRRHRTPAEVGGCVAVRTGERAHGELPRPVGLPDLSEAGDSLGLAIQFHPSESRDAPPFTSSLNNDGSQSCADVPGTPFAGMWSIATSADGRSVYAVANGRASPAHLRRSGPDGQIVWAGCLANTTSGGCGDIPFAPMNGAGAVAVSPDGRSVYVASTLSDSIAVFSREPVPQQPDPGGGPGPGGGAGPNADTLAPVISGLAVKRGRTVRFMLSEAAGVTCRSSAPGRGGGTGACPHR